MSEEEDKAVVQPTGFVFSKSGIGLNFQADTTNKKIVLIGSKSIELSVGETYQLIQLLRNLIDIVNDGDRETIEVNP